MTNIKLEDEFEKHARKEFELMKNKVDIETVAISMYSIGYGNGTATAYRDFAVKMNKRQVE